MHIYNKGTDPNHPDIESELMLKKEINQGEGFGELALLYNDKRSATIKAIDHCETYVLDGILFKQFTIHSSIKKR